MLDAIVSIITTVGFPIACCVGMFLGMKYQYDKDREERIGQDERYENVIVSQNELSKAVSNNTEVLIRISEKLYNV